MQHLSQEFEVYKQSFPLLGDAIFADEGMDDFKCWLQCALSNSFFAYLAKFGNKSYQYSLPIAPAKPTDIVWQTPEILLIKDNVCRFGHYTSTCLANVFENWQANFASQAMFVVVARHTSMLDN